MPVKRIGMRSDGMNYVFTPGKSGSLQARPINQTTAPNPLAYSPKVRAKVIPNKKRQGIATALGSVRG